VAEKLLIQRNARLLGDVLGIFGGEAPRELAAQLSAVIDALQFFGLSQLQVATAANTALTIGNAITINVPANQTWVLFNANVLVAHTVTMTALRVSMALGFGVGAGAVFSAVSAESSRQFGAGTAGTIPMAVFAPSTPRVLPPGFQIRVTLNQLGTDANANVGVNALVGVLG